MNYHEFRNKAIEYIRNIDAKLRRTLNKYAELFGLTDNQLCILGYIKQQKAANIGEIAAEFNSDCANISPVCKKLQKRGLLCKTRSKTDERVVLVSLTDAGDQIVSEVFGRFDEGFLRVFYDISDADAKNILHYLDQFYVNLQLLSEEGKC